jgi:hypothetical protein
VVLTAEPTALCANGSFMGIVEDMGRIRQFQLYVGDVVEGLCLLKDACRVVIISVALNGGLASTKRNGNEWLVFADSASGMRSQGMEPVVVLHHFVHPQWFEDLGGFTKEENIQHFVDFSCEAFR